MDLFLKILIILKRGRDMTRTIRIYNVCVSVCELNGGVSVLTSSYLEDHWLKVMSQTYDHHMHQNCTYRQMILY